MAETTALVPAGGFTPAELIALLQQSGMLERAVDRTPRLKFQNGIITTPDGEMFVYNPKKPAIPACTVRIVSMPDEYFGMWLNAEMANAIGRPELDGKPSRKYLHADPDRMVWDSDNEYDKLVSLGYKGKWAGDLKVQIAPESGEFTGDETTYILTLPTTSLIEFKGASRAPEKGSVSEKNFVTKVAEFALKQAQEANLTPEQTQKAIIDAMTSLRMGGVVAEIRTQQATDDKKTMTWTVLVFDPIFIQPLSDAPALTDGEPSTEDVPF